MTGNLTANLVVNYGGTPVTKSLDFVIQQPSPPGKVEGGGGGGGGGGGLAPTGSPYCTTFIRELREGFLMSRSPTTYTFRTQDFGIYEVVITPAKTLGLSDVRIVKCISDLKGVSQFPGIKYIFNDVWSSAKEFYLINDSIVSVIIRFKVDRSWLLDNNIADSSMKLSWYDGDKWIYIGTDIINRDDKYVYYEAATKTLGPFIIGTISIQQSYPSFPVFPTGKSIETPVPTELINETIVPEVTPVSSSRTLNTVITILIIGLSLSIITYLLRKK